VSDSILAEAAQRLRQGQELEAQGTATALERAVTCYNEAIALLKELPLEGSPAVRRELGVAWMNRGNALQRRTDLPSLAGAVRAYDAAIALLRELPVAENAAHRNTLGAAWMNRGHALYLQGDTKNPAAAVQAQEQAIALLRDLPLDENPSYRLNLAGAWMNQANALLRGTDPARFGRARASAQEAMALVAGSETTAAASAEMGLKARRALCEAIGQLLVADPASSATLAAEASDIVDDGLALVRLWEQRGVTQLRPLAARLFRFGAQLCRLNQPHFLPEYLLENLDVARAPDAMPQIEELHVVAAETIAEAVRNLQRAQQHLKLDDPASMRQLQTWRDLLAVVPRLAELRQKYFPALAPAAVTPAAPPAPGQSAT
jgi:hypothetical protein